MTPDPSPSPTNAGASRTDRSPAGQVLAFYLPQFHPIPENDANWGAGFTEWNSVLRAGPRFRGHWQPHLPSDLGFYDLRVPEVREAQADLARACGVTGFVYYHYWFHGRRLLDRPFREVLASGRPDFPFCLCWANEPWSRNWNGEARDVLVAQDYSPEDDIAHARALVPAFRDPRYVRIGNRPLFLVYRANLLPDPAATTARWRQVLGEEGIEPFLCRVESQPGEEGDPTRLGFDAAVDFQPNWRRVKTPLGRGSVDRLLSRTGLRSRAWLENQIHDYAAYAARAMAEPDPGYVRFPTVMPHWDNSARRPKDALIFHGASPGRFRDWVVQAAGVAQRTLPESPALFVNAWNEWGEGCHLEPSRRWGFAFAEALREGLASAGFNTGT